MLIFRGLSADRPTARSRHRARALTIGNFDGIHRGHQALLDGVIRDARDLDLTPAVISFEPHPKQFFNPGSAPGRIHGLRDKAIVLTQLGIEEFWILPFNAQMAGMSAEDFMERILHRSLHAQAITVGDDFCFGAKRRGTPAMLRDSADRFGWRIRCVPAVAIDGERASSSALRQALRAGRFDQARALLGRAYSLSGHVIYGQQLGRRLGFPTLNIAVPKDLVLSGIFVVSVHGLHDRPAPAVASVGRRPTVENDGRLLLEVHVLDWSASVYGRRVCVEFHSKLRDEARYADCQTMAEQIRKDSDDARKYFSQYVH